MLIRVESNQKPQRLSLRFSDGRRPRRLNRLLLLLWLATGAVAAWTFWRYVWLEGPTYGWTGAVLDVLTLFGWAGVLTLSVVWILVGRQWLVWRGNVTAEPISMEKLQSLSPADFERYVALVFRRKGYDVSVRGRSGDLGVDLDIVNAEGRRAVVQCKRYRSTVGPEVVRELYGTMIHERAAHAFLVTTADISDAAREWARGKPITLVDGPLLIDLSQDLSNV